MSGPTITVEINGQQHQIPEGTTVAGLVERLGLGGKFVAVERNLQVVPREEHAATPLSDGDRLEIVTLVGGG